MSEWAATGNSWTLLATILVMLLLAAMLTASAALKLGRTAPLVEFYRTVGVPADKLSYLAGILLMGAVGLVIGLWWAPIGIAAAAGLVLYFLAAVGFHLRAGEFRSLPSAALYLLLSGTALILRIAST